MGRKVLVVDDELDMRIYVTTLLETNGYVPLSATDGREGLEMARRHKPSLIILDVMMPRMGGIRMYLELKRDPELAGIPVIMLSAVSRKTFLSSRNLLSRSEGMELPPPAAYIEKPPESDQLLQAIRETLGEARQ
ncbi:MAG: response regulator [Deltaproteobacteria bacterium]|nr:response regulator [Deltaproteobacteria bacterium]MBW2016299.1 response regulator [Deltaproteobacteria bacterium]MBW2129251.1 response regulator [Deltaproteobacteria bacterium]MBW2304356.1 response regulator [Deltaproteobacteria bacterium]